MSLNRIENVCLRSIDGQVFILDMDLALMSTKIRHSITAGYINAQNYNHYINVAINSWTIHMIMDWCEQHKYDLRGAVGGDSSKLDQFDRNFFNKRFDILYAMFLAADYLKIEPLIEATFNAMRSQMFTHYTRQQFAQYLRENHPFINY